MSVIVLTQVETVGQVYMAVSGAPEFTAHHAENVVDVALCLLRQVKQLKLPSGICIQIRIGKISLINNHPVSYLMKFKGRPLGSAIALLPTEQEIPG